MVMGDTILRSGSNAAVVKIHNKDKAIAVTVNSSANYCKSYPLNGGKQIVCESWRNLISVGAKPIAVTNCLNLEILKIQKLWENLPKTYWVLRRRVNF